MGIGVIVKDCSREVLATFSAFKMFIIDPIDAKIFAAPKATIFCRELGLQSIKLEGNALRT